MIEDAAQPLGATYKGRTAWTAGTIAACCGTVFEPSGLPGRVRLPEARAGRTHRHHQDAIRVPNHDAVRAHLAAREHAGAAAAEGLA